MGKIYVILIDKSCFNALKWWRAGSNPSVSLVATVGGEGLGLCDNQDKSIIIKYGSTY